MYPYMYPYMYGKVNGRLPLHREIRMRKSSVSAGEEPAKMNVYQFNDNSI